MRRYGKKPPSWKLNWTAVVFAVLILPTLVAGCSGEERVAKSPPLPEWLVRVYPSPGADSTGARRVEIAYKIRTEGGEAVHLFVDGVDVTTAADGAPGLLNYNPREPDAPVRLSAGEHTAEARLVRLRLDSTSHQLIDRYRWRFSIL